MGSDKHEATKSLKVSTTATVSAPAAIVNKVDIAALLADPKAAQRMAEGRCTICGKPVAKPHEVGEGSTCHDHIGILRQSATEAAAVPEGFVRMSKVCDAAEDMGISRSAVVKAAGGDACTGTILSPEFNVVYVGRGKWMHPDVLSIGLPKLKAPAEPKAASKKAPAQSLAETILAEGAKRDAK